MRSGLSRPSGTFRDVATPLPGVGADDVAFGDFDGDGRLDAAGVNSLRSQLTLLRQAPDGTFVVTASIEMPAGVSRITSGDVDGDGRTDLVVVSDTNREIRAWVVLQVPGQPGTFAAPRLLP